MSKLLKIKKHEELTIGNTMKKMQKCRQEKKEMNGKPSKI